MQNILSSMSEKKFRVLSSLFCFFGDLIIVLYIFLIFNDFGKFKAIFIQGLNIAGIKMSQLEPDIIEAQFLIMTSTLKLMLAAFLFIHLIVYIFHIDRRIAATKYIKFSLLLTIPTSAIFIYEAWSINKIFAILFFIQVPLYIFSYKGINYFRLDQRLQKNKEQ